MDKTKKTYKIKIIIINLAIFAVLIFLIFFGLKVFLKSYTKHGESVKVPQIIDLTTEEGVSLLESQGFKYKVIDTVFDNRYDKNRIVEQTPIAGSDVKKGRKIYIKINSTEDQMVKIPAIIDEQIRDAYNKIYNSGLKIRKITYQEEDSMSIKSVNRVLAIRLKGITMKEGDKIKKNSEIDLVLSINDHSRKTVIPNLIGLTKDEATKKLIENYLNSGISKFDETVKTRLDSLTAKVCRQYPAASDTINKIVLGSNVDIWLTKN